MNSLVSSIRFFIFIFAELTVLFIGISTLIGLVFEYVPDETIRSRLKHKGFAGNFLGAALGAVTPFCSCSTIPMTVGFLRAGVPFGATISFLLASPLLNPVILAMFWALLGWEASMTYFLCTFAASMISGAVLEKLGFAEDVRKVRITGGRGERKQLPSFRGKLLRAFLGAWSDFKGVLPCLIIGVLIGAVVYGYIPADFVTRVAGPRNPLAVPVAAVIGIPLYVRAETVIPIGVALTQKGMSIGAVIALIIGGAGMSIPEMSMLTSIFRIRLVGTFIAVVFSTAVLAGFIFNFI